MTELEYDFGETWVRHVLTYFPTIEYDRKWVEAYQDLCAICGADPVVEFLNIVEAEHAENVRKENIWKAVVAVSS
jgi:hypothetical protein